MNLVGYIEKYGNRSFNTLKPTNIDYLIFAELTYIDLDGIVSTGATRKVTLGQVIDIFFDKYNESYFKIQCTATRSAIKVLRALKGKKRFKDLELYNYKYECSNKFQFSAVTYILPDKLKVIAFEGTDDLISGWREDFEMSYKFPVPAEVLSKRYINKAIKPFDRNEYVIVGHSKGGTLALYGSMYCDLIKQKHIKKIYSFDGPGLWNSKINSWRYRRIFDRYEHIVPNCSVVGMLFADKKYTVIKSNKSGIIGHDAYTWMIKDDDFLYTEMKITSNSFHKAFNRWSMSYSKDEKVIFVNQIFNIFKECNVTSVSEIYAKKSAYLVDIVKGITNLDKEAKKMCYSLLSFMLNDSKEMILNRFRNKNKKEQ